MAYKLSERKMQNRMRQRRLESASQLASGESIDWGDIATIFMVFGIISLLTSWFFSFQVGTPLKQNIYPDASNTSAEVGPITVSRHHETFNMLIRAVGMPAQSWTFVQGSVLDANKNYLFAFGDDLWHENGRDSDGAWDESYSDYTMKVTFPQPGTYYLQLTAESNSFPKGVVVEISKQRGSSLPHFWFGLLTLLVGIILNELARGTLTRLFSKLELSDD